jgi:hypothetical protein
MIFPSIKRLKYLREQCEIARKKWKEAENKLNDVETGTTSNNRKFVMQN